MTDQRSEFRCFDPHEVKYELLDPGIREVVRFLIAQGFHTTDSGDGEHKRSKGWTEEGGLIPFPHVIMEVQPSEIAVACADLVGVLRGIGIEVVSQTEAWMEVIKEHGNHITADAPDVVPRPYIEATYDPISERALVGLYNVTSDMVTGGSHA